MEILPISHTAAGSPAPPSSSAAPSHAANPRESADPPPPSPLSHEALEAVVQEIRDALKPVARSLQFSIDESLGKTVVRVLDGATKEVIRQIPSEEALEIAKALDKLQGVLLRQEA